MRAQILCGIGITVVTVLAAFGQTDGFEVISIKPAQGGAVGLFSYPGGRIVANSMTLELLMEEAYDVPEFQLSGVTAWMRSERYTIEAKPPVSSTLSTASPSTPDRPNEEQREMLRSLMEGRFQLKVHREAKDAPVYILVRGSGTLKFASPQNKDDAPWAGGLGGGNISGDGLAGKNISMAQLAKRLSSFMGRPVIDRTGLEGSFDFRYDEISDDPHTNVPAWIITSVQALGLRLESSRGPVETIVVDHVERPSAN